VPIKGKDFFDSFPTINGELSRLRESVMANVLYDDVGKYCNHYFKDFNFYPYQKALADIIILLSSPSARLPGAGLKRRVAAVASRQSGKSTTLIMTILYLLDRYPGFKVGVFAPKEEQAKGIIFKGIRDNAETSDYYAKKIVRSSQTHLELSNGSLIKAQAASPTSKIMGQDLDLVILDEAQDIEDDKIRRDILPMLAARNGLMVMIGTASTKKCYLYESLRSPVYETFKISLPEACAQNPKYAEHVEQARMERGDDDVLFRTQYMGEWVLEKGMFIEKEDLEKCESSDIMVEPDSEEPRFAGLDPACREDRSVLTIMDQKGNIVKWLSFEGDEYPVQFAIIIPALKVWNVKYMCVDSSGPQQAVYQMLRDMARQRGLGCIIEPRYFDPMNKHKMTVSLKRAIKNKEISYYTKEKCPEEMKSDWFRFKQEMVELEVAYKDYMMSASAPDKRGSHDDYFASACLVWDCYTTFSGTKRGLIRGFTKMASHSAPPMRDIGGATRPRFVFSRRRRSHVKEELD